MLRTRLENFDYEERDGFIFITKYNQADAGVEPMLEVPDTINGVYVTGIAKDAFEGVQTNALLLPMGLAVVDIDFSCIKGLGTVVIPTLCIGYVDNGGTEELMFNVDLKSPFHIIATNNQYKHTPFPTHISVSNFFSTYIEPNNLYTEEHTGSVFARTNSSDGEGNTLYVAITDFDKGYTEGDLVASYILQGSEIIKSDLSLLALEVGTELVNMSL